MINNSEKKWVELRFLNSVYSTLEQTKKVLYGVSINLELNTPIRREVENMAEEIDALLAARKK